MKFACDFFNTLTGELRTIVTELTYQQRLDALLNFRGVVPNPLTKSYAFTNATKLAPPGFIGLPHEIHMVH
jgi:hypothetical protein